MALTLAEYSKQALEDGNLLLNNIADWSLKESNMLQLIPWATNKELAVKIISWASFPDIGTRKIGAAFSESTGEFKTKIEEKYIFGQYIDVDVVLAKAGQTIGDVRQNQRKASAKSMAFKFNNMFINGNPSNDQFKGIKARVTDIVAAGFTDQYFDAGSATNNRGMLYDSTDRQLFMDNVSKLIYVTAEHSPDALLMNGKMYLAFEAAFRRETVLKQTEDMFGRIINTYSGVPLVAMGVVAAFSTTEIIPNNENLSSGSQETSIYAVKFGEEEYMWGVQQEPMEVIDLGRLQTQSSYRDEVSWVIGLAVSEPRSLARAYGFVASAQAS